MTNLTMPERPSVRDDLHATIAKRTRRVYDLLAGVYPASTFFFHSKAHREAVEMSGIREGMRVLEVATGSGVMFRRLVVANRSGCTVGLDLSPNMAARTQRVVRREFPGTRTYCKAVDARFMPFRDESFDAVVCVFGIFFVPDMAKAASELWSRVRAGGKLAVTTWASNFCKPASNAFWRSIKNVRPDLHKRFNPWDRIDNPESLRAVFHQAGIASPMITREDRLHPIHSAEDWWTIVLGSGYRGTIEQLDPAERQKVREANLAFIRDEKITAIETNVLYALATKA